MPESFEWVERTAPGDGRRGLGAGLGCTPTPCSCSTLSPRRGTAAGPVRLVAPWTRNLTWRGPCPGSRSGTRGWPSARPASPNGTSSPPSTTRGTIALLRERLRSGRSVLATASGPNGPLAAGSYQLDTGVAEITGVGVLPASRRRGLGAAVTHALAFDALAARRADLFLSATDAAVARIYTRLGFREIGTAMIAEPPDECRCQAPVRRWRGPGRGPRG